MKITSIKTKSGTEVPIGKFTVLVGPNNVGKSQTLRDIHEHLVNGDKATCTILDEIVAEKIAAFDDLFTGLQMDANQKSEVEYIAHGISSNLTNGDSVRINRKNLKAWFQSHDNSNYTFGNIGKFCVAYLDAESRLKVVKAAPSHNPHEQSPTNLLQGLFAKQDDIENFLRDAFAKTFGMDIRLDYSGMQQLILRVADKFPEIPENPQKAYPEWNKYQKLDDQGDGFRSFVGVVLSLLLSEGRVILLDEPEAFLHPAQSRQLGIWIANHADSVSGQIILATHNASFLSGILASGKQVDIFRMNRINDTSEYIRIPPDIAKDLVTSPLLSSQRVLEAIFFRGVVVCEADADRAVYQTVATKVFGSQEAMFVHAHNKQSVPRVVELLRAAHIPTSAIVDLDALNSSGELQKLTEAAGGQEEQVASIIRQREDLAERLGMLSDKNILANVRDGVAEFLTQLDAEKHDLAGARGALNRLKNLAKKWYNVKKKGIDGFPEDAAKLGEKILATCKTMGLFLVPCGELESWIDLGTTQKKKWVVSALEFLHTNDCPEPLQRFIQDVLDSLKAR